MRGLAPPRLDLGGAIWQTVVSQGVTGTLEALATWCQDRMRSHAVPEEWFIVDEIPKSDRGKINRAVVRQHCLALRQPLEREV